MKHDHTMQFRIGADAQTRLDDLRRAEEDLPTRSEMVRRLIERAALNKRKGSK